MPEDTIDKSRRLQGLEPIGKQQSKPQYDRAITDEAERIIAYLENTFPEKFDFKDEREACIRLGARFCINKLRNEYLKSRGD